MCVCVCVCVCVRTNKHTYINTAYLKIHGYNYVCTYTYVTCSKCLSERKPIVEIELDCNKVRLKFRTNLTSSLYCVVHDSVRF